MQSVVSTPAAWSERRGEVLKLAEQSFLGTLPEGPPPALSSAKTLNTTAAGDGVACTFVELTFDTSGGGGGGGR